MTSVPEGYTLRIDTAGLLHNNVRLVRASFRFDVHAKTLRRQVVQVRDVGVAERETSAWEVSWDVFSLF